MLPARHSFPHRLPPRRLEQGCPRPRLNFAPALNYFGAAGKSSLVLEFPWSGLLVPGILLGVDMIFHGSWWLTVGLWVRHPHPGGGTLAHA
jgi:hypothetical protein